MKNVRLCIGHVDKYTCYTCFVAQLNIYVSDEVAANLRRLADQKGVSISKYATSLLTRDQPSQWPPDFFTETCGFLTGDFPEIDDPPPQPIADEFSGFEH